MMCFISKNNTMNKKQLTIFAYLLVFLYLLINILYTNVNADQSNHKKQELMISAAISLQEIMKDLGQEFEKRYPNTKILFNFAASGQLRTQIENGAPADIFISASSKDMYYLHQSNLILKDTKGIFAKNKLVLITYKNNNNIHSLNDLKKMQVKKIAIGNPDTVPAGKYAEEALNYFEILPNIKPKLVLTENVRQALYYVSKNEVDAGIVFATDTKIDQNIKIVVSIPKGAHSPIIYPAAVIKSSPHVDLAKKFISFIVSPIGKEKLKKYGYPVCLYARCRF